MKTFLLKWGCNPYLGVVYVNQGYALFFLCNDVLIK